MPARSRMRWPRVLLWCGVAVLTLAAAVVTWAFTSDLGVFKPQIERLVSDITGRELRIDGDLDILVGRQTVLVANGLRFQNADWAGEPGMVEIGHVDIRFDLWSLVSGPVLVHLIDIEDAQIRLTRSASGDANWVLFPDDGEAVEKETGGVGIAIDRIDIERVRLTYSSPERAADLVVEIDALEQQQRPDGFLDYAVAGTVGDRDMRISGSVGTWTALLAGANVEYAVEGQLDTITFASRGSIDDLTAPRRPSVTFSAGGPSLADLTRMFGLGPAGAGDVDFQGSLVPEAGGPLVLRVAGNVGDNAIEANGSFSDLQNLEQIDLDLLASGPDLGRVMSYFGVSQLRAAPYRVKIDAERDGPSLVIDSASMDFGESRFGLTARMPNFPALDDANVDLAVSGPDFEEFRTLLGLPGAATGPFSLRAGVDVSSQGEESIRLDMETSLARVEAGGPLGPAPDYVGSRLQFRLQSDDLARLGGAWGIEDLPASALAISGDVEVTRDGVLTRAPLVAEIDGLTARLQGLVAPAAGLTGSDLTFEITGPSLRGVAAAFGGGGSLPEQAYGLKGRVQAGDDGIRFRDVLAIVGTSVVNVDGVLVPVPQIAGSRFTVRAEGPAFEEIVAGVGSFRVEPGPFELAGAVDFSADAIRLEDVELTRPRGNVRLGLRLGLPLSAREAEFDIDGRGSDVRNVLLGLERFEAAAAPFSLVARGRLSGQVLSLENLGITVADASVEARGRLDFEAGGAATDFSFSGNVPSLARLGRVDGRSFNEQSVEWSASVSGREDMLEVSNLVARIGGSDLNGNISYRVGTVPELTIDLRSDSLEYEPLLVDGEAATEAKSEFEDGRLLPDIAIPFEAMTKINASVDVDVAEFRRGRLRLSDLSLDAALRDGNLTVRELRLRAPSGRLGATAQLAEVDGTGRLSIDLVARDLALGLSDLNRDLAGTGNIDLKLESSGQNLRALAGNANGVFLLRARQIRLSNNRFLGLLYGDMLEGILTSITPFAGKEPTTNIECAIIPWRITDGVIAGAPNEFVRTDKINIAMSGTMNLKSEALDLAVRTTPRKGLTLSAGEVLNPYLKIVGTLAAPRLAVDEQGMLLTGGAAVATGGLSILARGLWDRLSRSSDPCGDVVREAMQALGDRLPDADAILPSAREADAGTG